MSHWKESLIFPRRERDFCSSSWRSIEQLALVLNLLLATRLLRVQAVPGGFETLHYIVCMFIPGASKLKGFDGLCKSCGDVEGAEVIGRGEIGYRHLCKSRQSLPPFSHNTQYFFHQTL